jgi:hypothetical protein
MGFALWTFLAINALTYCDNESTADYNGFEEKAVNGYLL